MGDRDAAHGLYLQLTLYDGTGQTSSSIFSQHHQRFLLNPKISLTSTSNFQNSRATFNLIWVTCQDHLFPFFLRPPSCFWFKIKGGGDGSGEYMYGPTQETTALAVVECVTRDRISAKYDCVTH